MAASIRNVKLHRDRVQLERLLMQHDHALEPETQPLEQIARSRIVGRKDRDPPTQSQHFPSVRNDSRRRLESISLSPKAWEKREPQIDVFQCLPLDEAAHPDRLTRLLRFDCIEPKAHTLIHCHRTVLDISQRLFLRPYAFVTDV